MANSHKNVVQADAHAPATHASTHNAGGTDAMTNPQFTTIELGAASDTTLARTSAGVITVEGNRLFAVGGTDVPIADGGTGQSTATTAFDALSPMTTAGDIILGGASGTRTRLAIGAAGTKLHSNGTTASWAFPPGYQLDYVENTTAGNVTATTEGTADVVVTGSAVAYDGSTVVRVECFIPFIIPGTNFITVILYDSVGTASIGKLTITASQRIPVFAVRHLTPSAATHTYSIRAYVDAGTGSFNMGVGGAAAYMPAFIRITIR